MKKELEVLSRADLADILSELKERGVDSVCSEEPHFEIVEFEVFQGDTGRVFKAYAKVNFYYLKKLKLYQSRKYRYNTTVKVWDRFDIKLKHLYSEPKKPGQQAPEGG
ncbi:hypothetical protein ACFL5V_08900 [Fibrobacterota bacterium]